jgi:hypothetical protein
MALAVDLAVALAVAFDHCLESSYDNIFAIFGIFLAIFSLT